MSQETATTTTRPQPPTLVVRCDALRGIVRARGRVDAVGAELVAAQVEQLHLSGHRRIRVELPPDEDAGAGALLAAQARRLEAAGVRVTLA
jgi:hypothetical protein